MKPLGRLRNLKGLSWKRDFRIRQNGKKIGNWWEDWTTPISNKSARRKLKLSLKDETK